MEKTMKVEGMKCTSCGKILSGILVGLKNVEHVNVDYKSGTVTITASDHDAIEAGREAILKKGYRVVG